MAELEARFDIIIAESTAMRIATIRRFRMVEPSLNPRSATGNLQLTPP